MAASGINEHKEGCRKQRVLDRAAHARRAMMGSILDKCEAQGMQYPPLEDPDAPGYMRKMGSPPGINSDPYSYQREFRDHSLDMDGNHSPTAIDRLRRQGVRQQQLVAYSAKIPNRLSSTNYTQQW